MLKISTRLLNRVKFVAPFVALIGAIAYVNYSLPTSWIVVTSLAIVGIAMIRTDPAIVAAPQLKIDAEPAADATGQSALEEMQNLVACLPDPCFLLRPDGEVIFQNGPAKETVGEQGEGESIYSLLRAPEVQDAIGRTVETGDPSHVQYFERVPNDRLLEVHVAPLSGHREDGAGEEPPLIMILHDLTQQHRLDRMRTDFIANASHELRTPLASLIGFIDTLKGPARNDTKAREKFLGIMETQAARMSRLIDDLLSLSRIEMNVNIRPGDSVDLAGVAGHVLDSLKPIAEERGVNLRFERGGDPALVLGYRDELVQVVQNLIENAIKYGEDGGRVEVGLRRVALPGGPDQVLLDVRDLGPGIAPEHVPRLTERFYRVDVASSREKGGTGLGLAIVKHILNRHKGTLKIDSVPGEGSVFTVTLDAARDGVTQTSHN
jgi:two-component system, OmpR family, phosphate regulon sensor histidine kinase PhoR